MVRKKLAPLAVAVVVIALTLVVLRPILKDINKLRKENQKTQKILAKLTNKAQNLESIDENEIQRRVKQIEDVFPSRKPVLDLINSLNQLANEEEVSFGGIKLEPGEIETAASADLQEFLISFSIEGDLARASSFVSRLEKIPPLMKIEELGIKLKEKTEEKSSQLSIGLTVRVYYQPEPANFGKIDQPLAILNKEEQAALKKIATFKAYPKVQPTAAIGKEDLFRLP